MALPTLDKTWQYAVNSARYTNAAQAMYLIKNTLCTFPSNPWVVLRSNNGSTVADADLWTSSSAITWNAGSPGYKSWIVLNQPAISPNFQFLIITYYYSTYSVVNSGFEYYVSENAGFTGGTTTSKPSASDEVAIAFPDIYNRRIWYDYPTAGRIHIMQSEDGECTRILIACDSSFQRVLLIEKARNPVENWDIPWMVMNWCARAVYYGMGGPVYGEFPTYGASYGLDRTTGHLQGRLRTGGRMPLYCAGPRFSNVPAAYWQTIQSYPEVGYPMFPVSVYCDSVGGVGRLGEFYDLWWGNDTIVKTGQHYPDDGSRQFAQVGNLIVPWDGGDQMYIN